MLPITLEIKNFFSHKESFIDFTLFDSALLIGNIEGNYELSNGCGKSTVLESILWCLFNKSRAASMDDIIFWGENYCKVCLIFKHNNQIYKVIRKRNKVNSTTHVEFLKQTDDEKWIDISGSTSSLTNQEIEKTIKLDFKTFINSAYFRQNDISEFAESDPSKKKEILKSIIDLSKWDEYEVKAKDNLKDKKNEIKILNAKIEDYDKISNEYLNAQNLLKESKDSLIIYKEKNNNLNNYLERLTAKYIEIKSTLDTEAWDRNVNIIKELKEKLNRVQDKLNKNLILEKKYKNEILQRQDKINKYNEKIKNLKVDLNINIKINELNKELIELKSNAVSAKQNISNLDEIKIVKGKCYVCDQPINDDLYDQLIHKHDNEFEKQKRILVYSQNKIKELEKNLTDYLKIDENNKNFDKLNVTLKAYLSELKIENERLLELESEIKSLTSSVEKIKLDILVHENILQSIKNDDFKNLHEDILKVREELKEINKVIENNNQQIGVLTEKEATLSFKIKEMDELKEQQKILQKEIMVLEKTVKLLGKNGIQVILLNAVINDLEKTSNEILSSICNEEFLIFLDTQRTGSDGVSIVDTLDLRVKKDGIIQNFKSLSGGEQFRVSLALRIALSEISSRHGGSALEFLLLDEINSPLDRHGIESLFINVIRALEKKYKILVITHNDFLKEKFNYILDVTKINGESSINFITI